MSAQFFRNLNRWLSSGIQIFWFHTIGDEARIEAAIKEYADQPERHGDQPEPYAIQHWSLPRGAEWIIDQKQRMLTTEPANGLAALEAIESGRHFVFMHDMGDLLNIEGNKAARRVLIELAKSQSLSNDQRQIIVVLTSSAPAPHPLLQDYVTSISIPLPDRSTLRGSVVDWAIDTALDTLRSEGQQAKANEVVQNYGDEKRDRLAGALMGLSMEDSRKTLAYALGSESTGSLFEVISDEKSKLIARMDGLSYVPHRLISNQEDLGGFEGFSQFLTERRYAYSPHAARLNLERPRGVVLLGPPGTAKTTAGRIAARVLGLDLITLDIGAMFQGLVGSTEARMRATLATISAMSRVCLLLDELDKSLGQAHTNQSTDSGTSSRVLAYLLKWLADRNSATDGSNQTFVVATMNRVHGMPPELTRPGRFDRIFYTSLPDEEMRKQILEIHLRRRGIDPSLYDLSLLSSNAVTEKFVGADLEEIVVSARMSAFNRAMQACETEEARGRLLAEHVRPTMEDLSLASQQICPAAKVQEDETRKLLDFCVQAGCSPVAAPRAAQTAARRRQIRMNQTDTN